MIYLVRHGQTDWNVERRMQGNTDTELNENGRKQAENVSNELVKFNINRIISSDLKRAKETANIINKKINCDITYDNRLREIDYGDFEGICLNDITEEDWKTYNTEPEKINAESVAHVFERVKSFFDELDVDDENILLVTHGGVLRMIRYYMKNKEKFDFEEYKKYINVKTKNAEILEMERE